jgi:ATP-dependent DNA ligase
VRVFYYVFDVLWRDGEDVRKLPLRARKQLLRETLKFDDPLRFTAHRNADGEAFFAEACRNGWEGLIAKRADSPYGGGRHATG